MNIQRPSKLKELIGLQCCAVRIGLGKGLRIEFGNRVFNYHSIRQGKDVFHGEWDLISEWSSWRIVQNDKIVCSIDDGEEISEPLIQTLLIGKLQDIIQDSMFDLSLLFDNGITVEFLGLSNMDCAFSVRCPDNIFFEFMAGNGWIEKISTSREGVTKDEELLANHSEKFDQRWSDLVPKGDSSGLCMDCGFFISIVGKFHFWDYGLCSNEASSNDGKLVGVKSGCNVFNKSII